jgi:hypothetical protein
MRGSKIRRKQERRKSRKIRKKNYEGEKIALYLIYGNCLRRKHRASIERNIR